MKRLLSLFATILLALPLIPSVAHASFCFIPNGCTGTSTTPFYGALLVGGTANEYEFTATSSLFSTTSANYWGSTKGYLTSLSGAASSTLLSDQNRFSNNNVFSTTTIGTINSGTIIATSSIKNTSVISALVLNSAAGLEGAYAGSNPCTSAQAAFSISATGVITCATVNTWAWPFTSTTWGGATANSTTTTLLLSAGEVVSTSSIGNLTAGTIFATSTNPNMLLSLDSTNKLIATSTPTAAAYNATSSTATSTFNGQFLVLGTTSINAFTTHTGAFPCSSGGLARNYLQGIEVCGNDNTDTGGVQHLVSNSNAGNKAWVGLDVVNNLDDNTLTHFFGLFLNSSTYTSNFFGGIFNQTNLGTVQNTDGPLHFVDNAASNGYIAFFQGLSSSTERLRIAATGFVGVSSSSPFALFSIHDTTQMASNFPFSIGSSTASATSTLFLVSNTGSTTQTGPQNIAVVATSTSGGGFNISTGCFAINGTCVSGGGGVSLSGGTANMLASWVDSSTLTATGTPQVTAINATSSIATSSFAGILLLGTTSEAATSNYVQVISNAVTQMGGLLINTWTNVTNAFSVVGSDGTTRFNIDTTATNAQFLIGTSTANSPNSGSGSAELQVFAPAGQTWLNLFQVSSTTGTATTTLFLVSNIGSTTQTGPSNIAVVATSTWGGGLNISNGCFAINGVCVSGGGGGGSVTQVNTTFPVLGGPITNSGTITWGGLATTSNAVAGNILTYSNNTTGVSNVSTSTVTVNSPLTGSNFTVINGASSLGCQTASGSQAGCLASVDWTTFNNKISWGQATSTAANQIVYTNNNGLLVSAASSSLSLPNSALQNSSLNFTYQANVAGSASAALGGTVIVNGSTTPSFTSFYATTTTATSTILGSFSVGSTTPFALFSLFASPYGQVNTFTNNALFAVGSSSPTGTTTLFLLSNTGSTTQTGPVNVASTATSTHGGGINISSGCFAINGTCVSGGGGGGTVTSVTASFPIVSSGGNTPNITWTGIATTSNLVQSNILYGSNNTTGIANVATSTLSASSPLTGSFTVIQANGSTGSVGCQTASGSQAGCLASADWTTFNNKIAWGQATSTSANQIVYTDNNGKLTSAASSSLNLPNTALANSSINLTYQANTAGSASVALGSTLTINGSTTPSFSTFFATTTNATSTILGGLLTGQLSVSSTTASSTFAGGIVNTGGGLQLQTVKTCSGTNALNTDANGSIVCGAVSASGNVGNWFTGTTWGGNPANSTSTVILFSVGNVSATSSIGNLTAGTITATTSITNKGVISALVLNSAAGLEGAYGGASACGSNNFVTALSALGATSCGTAAISGVNLGSNLNSLSVSTDFSGTSYNGSAAVSNWALVMSTAHTWTGTQLFAYTATTTFSAGVEAPSYGAQYFVATSSNATSTFQGGFKAQLLFVSSTTASSTFSGGIINTGGGIQFQTLKSCSSSNALTTDANGNVVCGAISASAPSGPASSLASFNASGTLIGTSSINITSLTATGTNATSTFLGAVSISTTSPTAFLVNDQYGTCMLCVQTATTSPFTLGDILDLNNSSNQTLFAFAQNGAFGHGTSTPWALHSIHAYANGTMFSTFFAIASSTASATTTLFAIDSLGHPYTASTSPPVVSSCGTSPSINGSDESGTVSMTSASTCTITFNQPWANANAVHCNVTFQTSATVPGYSETATALTVTATTYTGKIDYDCNATRPQ